MGVSLTPYKKTRSALIGHIVMIWKCGRDFTFILEFTVKDAGGVIDSIHGCLNGPFLKG